MKKLFGLILLFSAFTLGVYAQPNLSSPGEPKIEFKKDRHDFGKITEGTQATYDFVFTNTGDAPLVITKVDVECGCTTPYWPEKPIMPGKSDKITTKFDSNGRPGKFIKSVKVHTNIEVGSTETLWFEGEVLPKPAPK